MKQTVIKFIIEENKQHFSKTCFDISSAIFSSNWYKVQSWILSVWQNADWTEQTIVAEQCIQSQGKF